MKERGKLQFVFLLTLLLFVSFTLAQIDTENVDERYKQIEEGIDKIPLDDSGEIDKEKLDESFSLLSSKAEQRIEKVNSWIEERVPWLQLIFRMIPEVSWLFLWNIFFILFAITHLIFNAYKTWAFVEEKYMQYFFGVSLFLIFLITNVYLFLASLTTTFFGIFWNTILPLGVVIAIILIIIFGVAYFLVLKFLIDGYKLAQKAGMAAIGKKVADKAEEKEKVRLENELQEAVDETKRLNRRHRKFLDESD